MPRHTLSTLVALAVLLYLGVAVAAPLAAKPREDDKAKKVTINDLKFSPAKLSIKIGETVIWTNKDDNDHNVVADDGSFNSEENLRRGETFKHKFEKKGKYGYSCTLHPRMKGVISVTE